jgi:hypothetical protein
LCLTGAAPQAIACDQICVQTPMASRSRCNALFTAGICRSQRVINLIRNTKVGELDAESS